jgi:hypothetical protein
VGQEPDEQPTELISIGVVAKRFIAPKVKEKENGSLFLFSL